MFLSKHSNNVHSEIDHVNVTIGHIFFLGAVLNEHEPKTFFKYTFSTCFIWIMWMIY